MDETFSCWIPTHQNSSLVPQTAFPQPSAAGKTQTAHKCVTSPRFKKKHPLKQRTSTLRFMHGDGELTQFGFLISRKERWNDHGDFDRGRRHNQTDQSAYHSIGSVAALTSITGRSVKRVIRLTLTSTTVLPITGVCGKEAQNRFPALELPL